MLLHFLGDKKFMGGTEKPSIADYMFVPVLTMFASTEYVTLADPKITQYIADFKAYSKSWEETAGMQTFYVNSKK